MKEKLAIFLIAMAGSTMGNVPVALIVSLVSNFTFLGVLAVLYALTIPIAAVIAIKSSSK